MDIPALVSRQREYFLGGATLEPSERKESLLRLQKAILAREKEIAEALHADLRKSPFESYMSETGMVLDELRYICLLYTSIIGEKAYNLFPAFRQVSPLMLP